ncbi:DNA polymerase III alpha subunit [Sinorhizobium kostiense]|uniref:DNA polymerase III alpha subunit n=1 Tax=Sinorhizobium kostiense TaxID=76747 RepID=A0ABS4R2N3_9HYPH|nr:hypothetical protein [Sinorhizobium arboris]MBP2236636.1 DNA polymerase III alpha subunit [Sinorhizobium kostiense]
MASRTPEAPGGPIQGDMVHRCLRRREGKAKVEYPTPELQAVPDESLGVPLFQESAMNVAIVCGGSRAAKRTSSEIHGDLQSRTRFKYNLVSRMVRNGYSPEFAKKTSCQLEGFG